MSIEPVCNDCGARVTHMALDETGNAQYFCTPCAHNHYGPVVIEDEFRALVFEIESADCDPEKSRVCDIELVEVDPVAIQFIGSRTDRYSVRLPDFKSNKE